MDSLSCLDIDLIRKARRKNQVHGDRPLFVFPCGGNESSHASRRRFRSYLKRNRNSDLQNVFCLTAEDVSCEESLTGMSLVQQEAILADISDWIIVFGESDGSFCELGIFSALPHAAAITSIVLDRGTRDKHSFINDGPVREMMQSRRPLNKVFYVDLDNPFSSPELTSFVSMLRENVHRSLGSKLIKDRKRFNPVGGEQPTTAGATSPVFFVGPLVHELLDLLQLFGPLTIDELEELYFMTKELRYKRGSLRAKSMILSKDMRLGGDTTFTLDQVLGIMRATKLVDVVEQRMRGRTRPCLSSNVHLESYFMFGKEAEGEAFQNMRARFLLQRRHAARREGYFE